MESMRNVAIIDINDYKDLLDEINHLKEGLTTRDNKIQELIIAINSLKDEYHFMESTILDQVRDECNNAISQVNYDEKTSYYYQVLVSKLQEKGYISLDKIDSIILALINERKEKNEIEDEVVEDEEQ